MSGYLIIPKVPSIERGKNMSLRDYPSNDPFENQDIINFLTTEELRELSNLKELKQSNIATLKYFEEREGTIFKVVRARIANTEKKQ
jgi:hypothetical protein